MVRWAGRQVAISEVVGVDAPDPADFMVLDLDGVQGVLLRGGGRRDSVKLSALGMGTQTRC